jgi:hypothetical protein
MFNHAGVRREVIAADHVTSRRATLHLSCGHTKRLTSSSGILPRISRCTECEESQ